MGQIFLNMDIRRVVPTQHQKQEKQWSKPQKGMWEPQGREPASPERGDRDPQEPHWGVRFHLRPRKAAGVWRWQQTKTNATLNFPRCQTHTPARVWTARVRTARVWTARVRQQVGKPTGSCTSHYPTQMHLDSQQYCEHPLHIYIHELTVTHK